MPKVAFIDEMIADMKNGVFDYTKDGECSCCGECCADLLPVSDIEIRRIKKYMAKHGIKEQKHFVPYARPTYDFTCPFRNNLERKCVIYEVRPAIYRDFRCDKPRKEIDADKALYHGKYAAVSMRETFFGRE